MKLSAIYESKSISPEAFSKRLDSIGDVYIKSQYSVSVKIDKNMVDRVRALAKHARWQIHTMSNYKNGHVLMHISPIKSEKYKSPRVLYHITDKSNVKSIMQNGLGLRSNTPNMSYPRRVYLYPTKIMALQRHYLAHKTGKFANKIMEEPVVLAIDNSHGKYDTFVDPEIGMNIYHDYDEKVNLPVYTTKRIDPSDISIEVSDPTTELPQTI